MATPDEDNVSQSVGGQAKGGTGGKPPTKPTSGTGGGGGSTAKVVVDANPEREPPKQDPETPVVVVNKGDLVGHWRFEEGSGSKVKDVSGNGNDGQIVAGGVESAPVSQTPKWIPGHGGGKGLELNGTTEWVKVPSSDSLNTTGTNGSLTMSAWVKPANFDATGDDYNFIVSRHEVGTAFEHFGLGLLSGRPAISVHFFSAVGASSVPVDNTWHHVAGTYDGITMSVFLDGILASTSDIGWPIAADSTHLVIGGNQNIDVVKELWSGSIDDVLLYNRALGDSEIKSLAKPTP